MSPDESRKPGTTVAISGTRAGYSFPDIHEDFEHSYIDTEKIIFQSNLVY
jgi:hypothetical protein